MFFKGIICVVVLNFFIYKIRWFKYSLAFSSGFIIEYLMLTNTKLNSFYWVVDEDKESRLQIQQEEQVVKQTTN